MAMGRNVSPQLISMIATAKIATTHNLRTTRIGTPGENRTLAHRVPEESHILLANDDPRQRLTRFGHDSRSDAGNHRWSCKQSSRMEATPSSGAKRKWLSPLE